ncbi:helix-turn-helix domain-containing protein [Methylobacter sp. G7]|uniref:helix-turn-helix domain-containing protein n=1 Tax=Methylobacter sp. G7 TaxID=3230117 RepID=UPI003D803D88
MKNKKIRELQALKKPEYMHPADIKAALQKNNVTQRVIAHELEISETLVNNVIAGRSASRRVARLIAEATGFSVEQMWPGRYDYERATDTKDPT